MRRLIELPGTRLVKAAQQSSNSSEHAGCVVESTAIMQVAAVACDADQEVAEATEVSVRYASSSGDEAGAVGARVQRARATFSPPPPQQRG